MQQLTVVFSSGQSRNSRVILISRKSVRAVHYGTQLVVVGWMIRIWKWRRRRPTSCHNDLTTVDPPSDPVSMMLFSSISTRPTYLHTSIHPFVSVVCCWLVEWTEIFWLNVSELWSSGCWNAPALQEDTAEGIKVIWSGWAWWCDFEWIMDTRANNGCPFIPID